MAIELKVYDNGDHTCLVWLPPAGKPIANCRGFAVRRTKNGAEDFLHGAACHVCLFVSETTCERGNRFLDRRFVVPIDDPDLALFHDVP